MGADTGGPTYVVIPVRDRHEMIANLLGQLIEQVDASRIYVYDNESDPPQPAWMRPIPAPDTGVFQMWNAGIDRAERHAQSEGWDRWNVAVLNSDLSVAPNLLYTLARGLRSRPGIAIAYPNIYNEVVPYGDIAEIDNPNYAGQTMAGYCWMLAGETGLRIDGRYEYWYGDSDIERQARTAGYNVVSVGAARAPLHLDSSGHVTRERHRLDQARRDEARFAEKWGVDPDSLFLALNPEFGKGAE